MYFHSFVTTQRIWPSPTRKCERQGAPSRSSNGHSDWPSNFNGLSNTYGYVRGKAKAMVSTLKKG